MFGKRNNIFKNSCYNIVGFPICARGVGGGGGAVWFYPSFWLANIQHMSLCFRNFPRTLRHDPLYFTVQFEKQKFPRMSDTSFPICEPLRILQLTISRLSRLSKPFLSVNSQICFSTVKIKIWTKYFVCENYSPIPHRLSQQTFVFCPIYKHENFLFTIFFLLG